MKKITIPLISALAASVLTVILVLALDINQTERVKVDRIVDGLETSTLYAMDQEGNAVPLNFTEIARMRMDAVVHISSMQEVSAPQGGYQQLPDPFRDFFGDEFFKRYNEQQRQNAPQQEMPPQQRRGTGSGVIINSDGYIVTNNHVVADADELQVTLHDNRSYTARIIGTDPTTDLALVKINETNLSSIPMVDSDKIEVGEWVLAIGNPFNLNSTVTAGIVSAKSRNINILREQYAIESFIQTDAAINPGNSGGALVNMQGGLVGINTAIASPTGSYSGYGFAVPSNIVNKVVSDLLEYGTVQRGYLGVTIRNITGDFADEENLDVTEGVYVDSVLAQSAAAKAGIQSGDVIVRIDGRNIVQASELQEMVARHRPGDEVEIVVDRNGKRIERRAVLQTMEGNTQVASRERAEIESVLGAQLSNLGEDEARKLNVSGGVKIVKLYAGKLKSETNIREGFVITRINTKPIRSVQELNEILQNTSGGVMLEGKYEGDSETRYYAFGMQ